MSCQVEQIADCGDISTIARALFIPEREDTNWLSQCSVSLSSCGNLLAVGFGNRMCLLTTQWISSSDTNTYIISWSGTLPSEVTAVLALPICPCQQSSQNGPDWFCVIVGFKNGSVGFYTNTGHLLLLEKLDEKPAMKITCHTGTYGTLPDDIHILFQTYVCIVSGASLFQTLRNAKAQLARVQAGVQYDYTVDSRSISIRKWSFSDQETLNDAAVVGLELKNSYDHLLAASSYGGYDTWYRSIPPMNTLILGAGATPYVGFHYALEGGTTPPLQDVARAVANKIKSALPGWLGGGGGRSAESPGAGAGAEGGPRARAEPLSMRAGMFDAQRAGAAAVVSPDRRLVAVADSVGRVAVLDVHRGHIVRLFKGYRDAQCAFVQMFDIDNKKPQLSVVKQIKRAIFLIIYNPKKGLIDIRLMQRGNRVAVFTATKNGRLLYNTCGLVGAEKNYTHKKLNLPEFQCVLIDPDGKLKKFNIPFFYALEGENSERSQDLHTLRDLREYVKKTSITSEDYEAEIVKRASTLKTLELKKHSLEILIKKYDISPRIVMSCLEIFWDSVIDVDLNEQEEKFKHFFENLCLVTLFYRHINNESVDDMQKLVGKVCASQNFEENNEYIEDTEVIERSNENIEQNNVTVERSDEEQQTLQFHLLEDDNCILERLLHLAQENGYKDHQHARVTFADNNTSTYKEFVSCFVLEEKSKYISLKPKTSPEKLNNLASDTFKSILDIKDVRLLTNFVKQSKIEAKEIVKLLIMHIMNMSLEEISIELIETFIEVLYYLCSVTEESTDIIYNEMSPWWQSIRDMLVDMSCPLRSMIVAMSCKAVGGIFEGKSIGDEDAWVSVTKENAKWGILIGKLEDISLLSIILMFKDTFNGKSLPKLDVGDFNINLKYIYTRGKGSITELIAKWLSGMGVPPEAIVANELMEIHDSRHADAADAEDDGGHAYLFVQNNRVHVDDNPKIFKWLSLLRRQFPLSTSANYIIANMCWEYAMAWQKSTQRTEELATVVRCLNHISDLHLRLGLFSIIWSTYIKHVFEASCRLVNKVGRLPKEPLCLQDVGFSNAVMVNFLEITTKYLDHFLKCSTTSIEQEKQAIQFEKIWDVSMPSLVEVAQDTKNVNNDIVNLNYQISSAVYYHCHFNVKFSKPLDTLYDIDYQYIFDALTGNVVHREINMKASEKLRNPRMKFLTKLVRAALETVTCKGGGGGGGGSGAHAVYNSEECALWIDNITGLAELWDIDNDFINRQQVIGLYHLGYDSLAESALAHTREPAAVLPALLAITTQRLKRCQAHSRDQHEWIVTVPPHLYKRLQNTQLDESIPAHPSLATTTLVLQKILYQMDKNSTDSPADVQNIKLAELMIDTCDVLIKRKL